MVAKGEVINFHLPLSTSLEGVISIPYIRVFEKEARNFKFKREKHRKRFLAWEGVIGVIFYARSAVYYVN